MKIFLIILIIFSLYSAANCTVNKCYNLSQSPLWQYWKFDETSQSWYRVTDNNGQVETQVCGHCLNNNNGGDCTYKWLIYTEHQKNYPEKCYCNVAAVDPLTHLQDEIDDLNDKLDNTNNNLRDLINILLQNDACDEANEAAAILDPIIANLQTLNDEATEVGEGNEDGSGGSGP